MTDKTAKVDNPMAGTKAVATVMAGESAVVGRSGNASTDVATQRELGEVQGMIMLAKRFPRDQRVSVDKILNACTRPSLAECAVYQYARGGTDINGPSIRLAEAIAQNWGNFQFGVRELEQRAGESTVEAFAWDLETNTRSSKVFQVAHIRDTKKGSYVLTDARDIYETVANQGARRVRSCILALIPGDVVDSALDQCDVTLKTHGGEVTPDRIKAMVEKFAEFGVKREQLEARIQRRIDTVTGAQLVNLGKIYNSLKDGMSQASDWFDAIPAGDGTTPAAAAKSGVDKVREAVAKKPAAAKTDSTGLTDAEKAKIEDDEAKANELKLEQ